MKTYLIGLVAGLVFSPIVAAQNSSGSSSWGHSAPASIYSFDSNNPWNQTHTESNQHWQFPEWGYEPESSNSANRASVNDRHATPSKGNRHYPAESHYPSQSYGKGQEQNADVPDWYSASPSAPTAPTSEKSYGWAQQAERHFPESSQPRSTDSRGFSAQPPGWGRGTSNPWATSTPMWPSDTGMPNPLGFGSSSMPYMSPPWADPGSFMTMPNSTNGSNNFFGFPMDSMSDFMPFMKP